MKLSHSALVAASVLYSTAVARPLQSQRAVTQAAITPEVRIDGKREDFSVTSGGRVGPNEILALTFRQDAQIRLYDRNGKRVAVVGRKGSGPGEFRRPQAQGWLGDTLWVYDIELARITYVSASGRILRTVPLATLPRPRMSPSNSQADVRDWVPWGRGLDGSMIGSATLIKNQPSGRLSREMVALGVASDGQAKRLLSNQPDERWESELSFASITMASQDGSEVVRVEVSDLKESGEYVKIVRLTQRGDTVFSERLPYQGKALPRSYVDSILRRGIGADRDRAAPSSRVPSVFAPVTGLYAEPKGVTVLTMREKGDASSAVILNRTGRPIARIKIPEKSDVLAATATLLWLREVDADDIQSIVRYRITCGGRVCK